MDVGNRVRLKEDISPYEAGSEGVVDSVLSSGWLNVNVDKDQNHKVVDPPYPLSPSAPEKFEVI